VNATKDVYAAQRVKLREQIGRQIVAIGKTEHLVASRTKRWNAVSESAVLEKNDRAMDISRANWTLQRQQERLQELWTDYDGLVRAS
jgi:hypothetical protein